MIDLNCYDSHAPIYELFDFKKEDIGCILQYLGLIDTREECKYMSMSQYVFLYGDENEVYNKEERLFIESVEDIYVYGDFIKKLNGRDMTCRIIAAQINSEDDIKSAIFFMKEINKAIGDFTIFFIKNKFNYYFGARAFNMNEKNDCIISKPVYTHEDFEVIADRFLYIPDTNDFIEYYNSIVDALFVDEYDQFAYDSIITEKIENKFEEFLMLNDTSIRYNSCFIGKFKKDYLISECETSISHKDAVLSAMAELDFIKSFKSNTTELLFGAEAMAQKSVLDNTENDEFNDLQLKDNSTKNNDQLDFEIQNCLEDPEKMIKLLKQRKGI